VRAEIAALLIIVAVPATSAGAELSGLVTDVRDGDSLTLTSKGATYRVRLLEIDAPELSQPFGKESRTSLREICMLKLATAVTAGEDQYGRTLARVTCIKTEANAEQVRRGMAWVFDRHAPRNSSLFQLQAEARLQRRGLWSDSEPVAPWDFRRISRTGEVKGARFD
jgi:endonuclease YncB( thermonuclease family)